MTKCPVKIRPFPNDTEITCEVDDWVGPHVAHKGVLRDYAYPGSATTITWIDGDRRCFTGDWVECVRGNCTLPNGHPGRCAP